MKGPFTVIINPTANRSKVQRLIEPARAAFDEHGLEASFVESFSAADVPDLAAEAGAKGDVVVAMGGDGMVNMVANGLAGSDVVMGIIPCGTGNDFATHLGIPVRDPSGAVAILAGQEPERIDTTRISAADGSERVSVAVASTGFDSEVTETAERINIIKGPARYTISTFITLARTSPAHFTYACDDGKEVELDAWLIAVGNSSQYGGGMKITPEAELSDGLLDVCIIGPVNKFEFIRTFPKVFSGRHIEHPANTTFKTTRIKISADREFTCYADGETVGPLPVDIRVDPLSLSVIGSAEFASGPAKG